MNDCCYAAHQSETTCNYYFFTEFVLEMASILGTELSTHRLSAKQNTVRPAKRLSLIKGNSD